MSWRQFILALGLYTEEEMQTDGFGVYWAESARQIPDKGDLRDYWIGISSSGDFLGTALSYTLIRDLILRLCHRLIACSIAGRSQAPKKVTVTDLFYLRGMDVGSVNVPYLLARYLRLFAAGRKSGAHIFGRQFVARLAKHFGLLTAEILGGLTAIAPELPIIDMTELVRLQICAQFDDTWVWVAMGPERQSDAAAGAPDDAKDALIVDEGGQADPTPEQAPQQPPPPPPAHARTMPQRMARLEENVHEIRRGLTKQREGRSCLYAICSDPCIIPEARQTEDWRGQHLRGIAGPMAARPMIPPLLTFYLSNFKRISLTGFRSCASRSRYQSISKQTTLSHHRFFPVDTSLIHIESRKSPTKSLFDVGSRRISIFTVNTKEYHSDVLAIITRIMRRT
ncbi:hypothetical protein Tco_1245596 [Tanacetum coccineum]